MIQAEERQNQQLLDLSTRLMTLTIEIHSLTTEMHELVKGSTASGTIHRRMGAGRGGGPTEHDLLAERRARRRHTLTWEGDRVTPAFKEPS